MNRELLTKFRTAPATMTDDELKAFKEFLTLFLSLFSTYAQCKDYEGIAKNMIKSDIDTVEWYIAFRSCRSPAPRAYWTRRNRADK